MADVACIYICLQMLKKVLQRTGALLGISELMISYHAPGIVPSMGYKPLPKLAQKEKKKDRKKATKYDWPRLSCHQPPHLPQPFPAHLNLTALIVFQSVHPDQYTAPTRGLSAPCASHRDPKTLAWPPNQPPSQLAAPSKHRLLHRYHHRTLSCCRISNSPGAGSS